MSSALQVDRGTSAAEQAALHCAPINRLERYLVDLVESGAPAVNYPVTHRFIPKNGALDSGLYVREATLTHIPPLGTIYITEIHRTEHPFVISKGAVRVWDAETGTWFTLRAPFTGITKPGTRRVIVTLEETVWTTFHATDETDVAKIGAKIILPHDTLPAINLEAIPNLLQR